jgi:hypothetical protein
MGWTHAGPDYPRLPMRRVRPDEVCHISRAEYNSTPGRRGLALKVAKSDKLGWMAEHGDSQLT